MLIVLRNRGDNEIMRAARAALAIIVAIVVVVRVVECSTDRGA